VIMRAFEMIQRRLEMAQRALEMATRAFEMTQRVLELPQRAPRDDFNDTSLDPEGNSCDLSSALLFLHAWRHHVTDSGRLFANLTTRHF